MVKKRQLFRISITHLKVLETVRYLNKDNAFPSASGVAKILNGVNDEETKPFVKAETFATLLSYRGRKLTSLVTNLVRRNYLSYVYTDGDNQKYLKITPLGEATLLSSQTKNKVSFVAKKKAHKKTILFK
ncbi:MAG: RQC domain-containing protein [Bacilli bacterium]